MLRKICRKLIREIKILVLYRIEGWIAVFNNPYSSEGSIAGVGFKLKLPGFNKYCKEFDVFNYNLDITSNLEWSEDFINGATWPNKWHKTIKYKISGKSDVKVPWELGRGQCFTHLAVGNVAGILSLDVVMNRCNEFFYDNKVGFGVQWQCPMDVSIRLVNLILVGKLLAVHDENNSHFFKNVLPKAYCEHINYLNSNMEEFQGGFKNNHYLSNLLGKAWFYALVKEDVEASKEIYEQLLNEVNNQFLSDGSNFEGSTAYHFLSTEIIVLSFSAVLYLFRKKSLPYDTSILSSSFNGLLDFCRFSVSRSCYPTRFGDDDSGMVIRPIMLSKINISQKNCYIAKCRLAAFESFSKLLVDDKKMDCLTPVVYDLMYGAESFKELEDSEFKSFRKFGLYKYSYNQFQLYLRHIEKLGSDGLGGHNHQDDTSIELFYSGKPIIVDPGTYCYTSDSHKRNNYRSVRKHNVTSIKATEQFLYRPFQKGLFILEEKPSSYSTFNMINDNYYIESNRLGFKVSRKIDTLNFEIIDTINEEDAILRFHLFPGLNVELVADNIVMADKVRFIFTGFNKVKLKQYMYSDFYLNERLGIVIEVFFNGCVVTKIECV